VLEEAVLATCSTYFFGTIQAAPEAKVP